MSGMPVSLIDQLQNFFALPEDRQREWVKVAIEEITRLRALQPHMAGPRLAPALPGTVAGKVIEPGDTVTHALQKADHDYWVGYVMEQTITRTPEGSTTQYRVRWVKPHGDPSDASCLHHISELRLYAKGAHP